LIELSNNIFNYLENHFGKKFAENYKEYVASDFKNYIRISGDINQQNKIAEILSNVGISLSPVNSVPNAYSVESGADKIGKTLEHVLGKYYIQSLSSMIPSLVISPNENDFVLDMCAAPGSKSTQISGLMNNKGTFYANESSGQRIKSLVFNIDKTNIVNVGVLQFYGEMLSKYFHSYFDKILVDAPCSGLGIVQKKGEVSNWWNENQVMKLVESQWKLLVGAIKSVKVGGEIIYSTCTMTIEENELLLNKILEKYPVELEEIELPVNSHPAFTKYENTNLNPALEKAKRIIPWEINSEGFFIAKLRKISDIAPSDYAIIRDKGIKLSPSSDRTISKYINDINDKFGIPTDVLNGYKYILKGNDIFFVDENWQTINPNLFTRIGTHFGSVDKYGNCILHSLAAQLFENHIEKNKVELTEAKDFETYMSGGIIKSIVGQGQKVVTFNGYLIGTAVASKEGLKSQFPRAMRMQKVIY